ncbi:MAG: hypothetical protein KDB88_04070, partial [Flavobacteriales bacterium]|nr:hypothetical protein [Flavobacteriales bacterium]
MKINRHVILSLTLTLALGTHAQNGSEIVAQLGQEDQESLRSLVMYPAETRAHILEAATQPGALIKMEKIQERSSEAFNAVIDGKDQETQRALWDLTRYPGLVNALVGAGPGKTSSLDAALKDFDPIIHARARELHGSEFASLEQIAAIQRESDAAFDEM